MNITITSSAKKFMEQRGIKDVTFRLKILEASGCCIGIVKEIEPTYEPAENATGYRYFQADGNHFFISREIKILGPLSITTEGFWNMKRLALEGATIPI